MDDADLVKRALDARARSYSPYSGFAVGAALRLDDGSVVTGTNVENASYGLTVCAERVAVFTAVASGRTGFAALAVATDRGASMCGACRQVVREFAEDLPVLLADAAGNVTTTSIAALLPGSFGPESLGGEGDAT